MAGMNMDLPPRRRRLALYLALLLTLGLVVIWPVFGSAFASEALEAAFEAVARVAGWGISIGEHRITVGQVVTGLSVLYASILFSRGLRRLLRRNLFARGEVDAGVLATVSTLLHYAVVVVGSFAALSSAGFDLSNFALVAGALGVGIGFGLQNLVQNFASGLILLVERPVRVGDTVEIDGRWADVRKIGLRSTVVETVEGAEIIVPNSLLVAEKVINWTLSSRRVRLSLPVSVSFNSSPAKVVQTLIEAGKALENHLEDPPVNAVFLRMAASTLDFELRVWLKDAAEVHAARSQLVGEVLHRCAEAGIEIPRPQHDIWLHGPAATLAAPEPPRSS